MIERYDVEVRLIALTFPVSKEETWPQIQDASSPVEHDPNVGFDAEDLIEYASRLCVDKTQGLRSRENYIRDRIAQGHESVIEHASASFYIRCSRVVTHELVRHRIASYSQRSQRYVRETEPRFITPPEFQAPRSLPPNPVTLAHRFTEHMVNCWNLYYYYLQQGVPPEIARYVLPNACQAEIVMTMNFRELRHFIKLRTSSRALPEMQAVAGKVREICKEIAPQVFTDL